jgi:hypothetical protein
VLVGRHGLDDESGVGQEGRDVSGEVAAAEEWLGHRFETALTAGHLRVGGDAVLDEVESATRLDEAADLAEGGVDVGNGTQRPGGENGIGGRVG